MSSLLSGRYLLKVGSNNSHCQILEFILALAARICSLSCTPLVLRHFVEVLQRSVTACRALAISF